MATRETATSIDTVEVKFWDKLRGLELLAKLKGLLKPEVKVEPGSGWKAVLQQLHAEDAERRAAEETPDA